MEGVKTGASFTILGLGRRAGAWARRGGVGVPRAQEGSGVEGVNERRAGAGVSRRERGGVWRRGPGLEVEGDEGEPPRRALIADMLLLKM